MPAPSTLLSVFVLVATLLLVVGAAYAFQEVRYAYLLQLGQRIAGTHESVYVGAWFQGETGILSVDNLAGTGVHVKALKVTLAYKVTKKEGGETKSYMQTTTKVFKDFTVAPWSRKLLVLSIKDDVPPGATADIMYATVIVATDKNVFIFNRAPPLNGVVLTIRRGQIGKSFYVDLPNGETAVLRVYEYLMCSVSPPERADSPTHTVDATKIFVATSQDSQPLVGFYNYGFDPKTGTIPRVAIDVVTEEYKLPKGGEANVTVCQIASTADLGGSLVVVSRGLILLGTHLAGYDVVALAFATPSRPELSPVPEAKGVGAGKSYVFVTKVPLPDKDVDVYDFMSAQITPYILSPGPNDVVFDTGNYFSQAILVGQAYVAPVARGATTAQVGVIFKNPYPVMIVIQPPLYSGP